MQDKIAGIALEEFRVVHEMGALVHDLNKIGEIAQPVQGNRERLIYEAIGRDADHKKR
jgi:hypothetical protein